MPEAPWDSLPLLALAIWRGVTVGAALLNMLVSWTFSWSELILDYSLGVFTGMLYPWEKDLLTRQARLAGVIQGA